MHKGRLEAFSDGVIAIAITIMVLELKVPTHPNASELVRLWPVMLSYIMSFINIGIYWNNHHHMFQAVTRVNGAVLWANLHLLFWMSLFPFCTAWVGENHFATLPMATYAVVLFMAAVGFVLLQQALLAVEGPDSTLSKAVGNDKKSKFSLLVYFLAIPLTFVSSWLGGACFILIALVWLIPDPRIEKTLIHEHQVERAKLKEE